MSDIVEQRLQEHGQSLPVAPEAVGYYIPVTQVGQLVVTSGQLPMIGKELTFKGKVGGDLREEDACHAARICTLNALAQIKSCIGSLDKVKRIVRVEGYVQSADGYTRQPHVINAASELLVQAFGDAGKHTRIAVGVNELPLNAAVELVVWAEVD